MHLCKPATCFSCILGYIKNAFQTGRIESYPSLGLEKHFLLKYVLDYVFGLRISHLHRLLTILQGNIYHMHLLP